MTGIQYVYRNVDKSEAFNSHVEEHIKVLESSSLNVGQVRVGVEKEGTLFRVTLMALAGDTEVVVCKTGDSVYQAFERAFVAFKSILNKVKTEYARKRREKFKFKHEDVEMAIQEELEFEEDTEE